MLVRRVSLSRWRWTLGELDGSAIGQDERGPDPRARAFADAVDRASLRLPSKCLPRAVALQWRLRLAGIPSSLIIAFHLVDRTAEHGFHAWVEQAGKIVIGHCDRDAYRAALTLSQGNLPAPGPA